MPIALQKNAASVRRRKISLAGTDRRVDSKHETHASQDTAISADLKTLQAEVDRLLQGSVGPAKSKKSAPVARHPAKQPLKKQATKKPAPASKVPDAKRATPAPLPKSRAKKTSKVKQAFSTQTTRSHGKRVQVRLSRPLIRVLQQFSECGHRPGRIIERSMWRDGDIQDAALILGISAPHESAQG